MNTVAMISSETSLTIRDQEIRIEDVFDRLRQSSERLTPEEALSIVSEMRELLAPNSFRCSVQLQEDGRKKRSTAAAANWKFETGEIIIFYEQVEPPKALSGQFPAATASPLALIPTPAPETARQEQQPVSLKAEIQQCCQALAEAEKGGKQFIALKWFRDLSLAALPHAWVRSADERQRVLTEAIDCGAILTRKIPNPKSPVHPTTTVSLNRSSSVVSVPSRFNPVPVKGEPASLTLLKDRGRY